MEDSAILRSESSVHAITVGRCHNPEDSSSLARFRQRFALIAEEFTTDGRTSWARGFTEVL